MEENTKDLLSNSTRKNQEEQIKLAEAEMDEVKGENERLKLLLARIAKDYKDLQMHFFEILQHEKTIYTDTASSNQPKEKLGVRVSLSLGITSTDHEVGKDDKKDSTLSNGQLENEKLISGGLSLGLDCISEPSSTENTRNASSKNSLDQELKEDQLPTEIWPPNKTLKDVRSGHEEVLEQRPLKKARFSVRARCDTPTMSDGCQWRKYGQKIAKGNPCPRGYYRCTVSPSCPVRKQVQRCADDMSVLITTYEGNHDHPLSISAAAMASTTSAAASMLRSRSSSSTGIGFSASVPISSSTIATNLHGFNFSTLSQTSRPPHFYIPNSSISTSNSHPTVTLDLTSTAPSTSSPLGRFSSSLSSTPRYSSTCLNFSSLSSASLEPKTLQPFWNGYTGYHNYGTSAYNQNLIGYMNAGKQPGFPEHLFQTYMNNQNASQPFKETIEAATKAITSNPNFQSVLAEALTSYTGDGGRNSRENQCVGNSSCQKMKWDESLGEPNPIFQSSQNGIGCGSSYLNKSSSLNSPQQSGLTLFPTSLQLSASKSSAASADNRDLFKL